MISWHFSLHQKWFREPVRPGALIEMRRNGGQGRLWKFKGTAKVAGKLAALAEFGAMIVDRTVKQWHRQ